MVHETCLACRSEKRDKIILLHAFTETQLKLFGMDESTTIGPFCDTCRYAWYNYDKRQDRFTVILTTYFELIFRNINNNM